MKSINKILKSILSVILALSLLNSSNLSAQHIKPSTKCEKMHLSPTSTWQTGNEREIGEIIEEYAEGPGRSSMASLDIEVEAVQIIRGELESILKSGKMWNTITTVDYWEDVFRKAGKPHLFRTAIPILRTIIDPAVRALRSEGTAVAFARAALEALPKIGAQPQSPSPASSGLDTKAKQLLLEHMRYVAETGEGISNVKDIRGWKQLLGLLSARRSKYKVNVSELLSSDQLLQTFIDLFFETFRKAKGKTHNQYLDANENHREMVHIIEEELSQSTPAEHVREEEPITKEEGPQAEYDLVWDYLRTYFVDIARDQSALILGRGEKEENLVSNTYGIPDNLRERFFTLYFEVARTVQARNGGILPSFQMAGREMLRELQRRDSNGLDRRVGQIRRSMERIRQTEGLRDKTGIYLEEVFQAIILSSNAREWSRELEMLAIEASRDVDNNLYSFMSRIIPILQRPSPRSGIGELVAELNAQFLRRTDVGHLLTIPSFDRGGTIFINSYEIVRTWKTYVEGEEIPAYLVRTKYNGLSQPEFGHSVPGQPYVVVFENLIEGEVEKIYKTLFARYNNMFQIIEGAVSRSQAARINNIVIELLNRSFGNLSARDAHSIFDIGERIETVVARHEYEHQRREKIYWGQTVHTGEEEKAAYLSQLADAQFVHYTLYHLFEKLISGDTRTPHGYAAEKIAMGLAGKVLGKIDRARFLALNMSSKLDAYLFLFGKLVETDEKRINQAAKELRQEMPNEGFVSMGLNKGQADRELYVKAYRNISAAQAYMIGERDSQYDREVFEREVKDVLKQAYDKEGGIKQYRYDGGRVIAEVNVRKTLRTGEAEFREVPMTEIERRLFSNIFNKLNDKSLKIVFVDGVNVLNYKSLSLYQMARASGSRNQIYLPMNMLYLLHLFGEREQEMILEYIATYESIRKESSRYLSDSVTVIRWETIKRLGDGAEEKRDNFIRLLQISAAVEEISQRIAKHSDKDLLLHLDEDGRLQIKGVNDDVCIFDLDSENIQIEDYELTLTYWDVLSDRLKGRKDTQLEMILKGLELPVIRQLLIQTLLRRELISKDRALDSDNLQHLENISTGIETKKKISISSKLLIDNIKKLGRSKFEYNQNSSGIKYLFERIQRGFNIEVINESGISDQDLQNLISAIFGLSEYFSANKMAVINQGDAKTADYKDGILLLHENSNPDLQALKDKNVKVIIGETGVSINVLITVGIYKLLDKSESEMKELLLNLGYTEDQIAQLNLKDLIKLPPITSVVALINDIAAFRRFIDMAA